MSRVHFGIGKSDIARVVAAHEREWHLNRANDATTALDGIDAEIERSCRTASLGILRDDRVFHGRQSPTGTIESWAGARKTRLP
jgi:hypothetical protein